jgi:superfamily II DNA or RNA helicase
MKPVIQLRPHQHRALDALAKYLKGQVVMPTASGKTNVAIFDALREFEKETPQTIVVVAPRIMLAEQLSSEFLEFITNVAVMHVHSGETHHYSTTKPSEIQWWDQMVRVAINPNGPQIKHKLIFTTYNSLQRLQQADIHVDTIYFDEAHNSVQRHFFPATEHFSSAADRCYFFTATPKHSATISKPGMNDSRVYGQVICNVPAPELVKGGFIVPPQVMVNQINSDRNKDHAAERDCMTLLDTILNEDNMQKVLVAAPNTKVLIRMLAETDFMPEVQSHGYDVMWITAKYGAFINNQKVGREVFFDTLTKWGKDPDKKFIILHYSILSEGINCPGLTSCVLMRNMDYIAMAQTIGRVIRLHPDDSKRLSEGTLTPGKTEDYVKSYGFIHVPVYSNTGISTAKRLQSVADTIFVQGEPAISTIKR